MVVELVPLGSLDKLLAQYGPYMRTRSKLSMCEQIAAAMAELARQGVLHGDLAARNVLVASIDPVHVKVSDFGLSRRLAHLPEALPAACDGEEPPASVPAMWVPPEVIRDCHWSEKSDVWAFGVTVWEIFSCGALPYPSLRPQDVLPAVLAGKAPALAVGDQRVTPWVAKPIVVHHPAAWDARARAARFLLHFVSETHGNCVASTRLRPRPQRFLRCPLLTDDAVIPPPHLPQARGWRSRRTAPPRCTT